VWDLKPFLKKYVFEESSHDEEKRLMLVTQLPLPSSSSSSSASSASLSSSSAPAGQGHGRRGAPDYTEAQIDKSGCAIVLWKRLLYPKPRKPTESVTSNRLLYMHPDDREPEEATRSTIERLFDLRKSVVVMCHGGYFAAAVFERERVVAHKTFHSYIVRRKQGGRQSNRDKSGRRPKSGGAQIRRHNEEKHNLNVRALINSWASHLRDCDLIFIHLPSHNKTLLIDKDQSSPSSSPPPSSSSQRHPHSQSKGKGKDKTEDFFLSKDDPRLRTIPFATHRPSLSEVKRVFQELTTALLITFDAPLAEPHPVPVPVLSSSLSLRLSADPDALVDELRSSGEWEPTFAPVLHDDNDDNDDQDPDDDDQDLDQDSEGEEEGEGDDEEDDEDE